MLQEQYRMHPEISRFPSARFYGGRLVDVRGNSGHFPSHNLPPYAVVDVASGAEEIYRQDSHIINRREADALAHFAKQLAAVCKDQGKIAMGRCPALVVITFYNGQARLIRRLLGAQAGVEVHTVDSFQGSEAEVVLLSFVRANAQRRLGFLSEFRRLNVALTRAKHSLIVFANATLLKGERSLSDDVAALFEDASRRKLIWREDELNRLLSPTFSDSEAKTSMQSSMPSRTTAPMKVGPCGPMKRASHMAKGQGRPKRPRRAKESKDSNESAAPPGPPKERPRPRGS